MSGNIVNKEPKTMNFFHFIVLLVSWLTISPLFYFLGKRWESFNKRNGMALLLVSPLFLILYLSFIIWGASKYYDYQREHKFANKKVLSRITEAPFPGFRKKQYIRGRTSFTGDYMDKLSIEFSEIPSDEFYQTLDSLANVPDSNWHRKKDGYWYNKVWGNGLLAPKGENDEEDMSLLIWITKGDREARIEYGAW